MTTQVRIGVLRLADSAPIMVAEDRGLFAELDLDVRISVEPSWANLADKLAYGLLDAAVMLPPLVLASALGLRGPKVNLIVPMGLTQGGNSIVFGPGDGGGQTVRSDRPQVLDWLKSQPRPPRLGVVHHFSTHNLMLRYWLSMAGADPDRDFETIVVPPEQVVDALAEGRIAGFCAGAPWGDVARLRGVGEILVGTSSIWPSHPEKCLAVHGHWAVEHGMSMLALIRALLRAQAICDQPSEADAIATLLARPDGLGLPWQATRMALPGGSGIEQIRFHTGETWFPAHAHAVWFLRQMRRWGWLDADTDLTAAARQVYRPDLLAPAVRAEGLYPAACVLSLEGHARLPMPNDPAFARAFATVTSK